MKFLRKLFPAVAVALAAGPALAAVTGSHHDLTAYQAGATEVCLYCHGVTDATTPLGTVGNVGEVCMTRCHRGGGFVTVPGVIPNRPASISETGAAIATVETPDAVRTDSGYAHGLTKANLLDPTTGTTPDTFNAIGLAFPYGGNAVIECTTCHDVHNNANTPFLQANLFTGGPAGRPSFCEACHTTRGNSWASTGETLPNGEHPTNLTLAAPGNVTRTMGGRLGRYINLDGNIFDTASANGAALNGTTSHYTTGGKVSGFVNSVGGETFGCYTCHAVHVDSMGAGWQAPNLILRDATSANGQWNPICVGCHGSDIAGTDDPNPGLSTRLFYHPVGSLANAGTPGTGNIFTYQTSTGTFSFSVSLNALVTLLPQGAIADSVVGIEQVTGRPRCGSCHDVHGGIAGSMALIDFDGARDGIATTGQKVCDACHNGAASSTMTDVADDAGGGETANSHHRTRSGSWATATVTDADGNTLNLDGANSASWLTAADHANGLDCADCHTFDNSTNSTAHNW